MIFWNGIISRKQKMKKKKSISNDFNRVAIIEDDVQRGLGMLPQQAI